MSNISNMNTYNRPEITDDSKNDKWIHRRRDTAFRGVSVQTAAEGFTEGLDEDNILKLLSPTTTVVHDHNNVNYNEDYSFQNAECNEFYALPRLCRGNPFKLEEILNSPEQG